MRKHIADESAAAVVYFGTIIPVYWWAPSPADFLIALLLVAGWMWFYSRLADHRRAATRWERRASERYTYEDVEAFLKTSQSHYEPGSASWLAIDLQVSALRVSLVSGKPLVEVDPVRGDS